MTLSIPMPGHIVTGTYTHVYYYTLNCLSVREKEGKGHHTRFPENLAEFYFIAQGSLCLLFCMGHDSLVALI